MSEKGTYRLYCQEAVKPALIMINNIHIPEKIFFSLSHADFLKNVSLLNMISGANAAVALGTD